MDATALERLLAVLDVRVNALAECKVAAGWRLVLPRMEAVVVHYVLAGDGVLCTDDGTCVALAAGHVAFVPAHLGHFLARDAGEANVVKAAEQSWPLGDGMMSFTAGSTPDLITVCAALSADCGGLGLFESLREPIAATVPHEATAASLALIAAELAKPRFGTRALIEALMKQHLILALREQIDRGELAILPLAALQDRRLLKAVLAMLERPAEPHTVDDLARLTGMSRSLFAERFVTAFDRPPMDLLKQVRLHRAADLLRRSRLPVAVVAMSVGYASRSYFSRAFRAAYGLDPQSFRQQARGRWAASADDGGVER